MEAAAGVGGTFPSSLLDGFSFSGHPGEEWKWFLG